MTEIDLLFWIPAFATFVSFAWAIKFHFVSARTPIEMKVISGLAACVFLAAFIASCGGGPGPLRKAVALTGVIGSASLFVAALAATRGRGLSLAYDERRPGMIVMRGPYAWIRHPFYAAYILFWAMLILYSGSAIAAVVAAVLVGLYVRAARREEAFLLREIGDVYRIYAEETGFLIPRL